MLGLVISPAQGSFVSGRQILNGIFNDNAQERQGEGLQSCQFTAKTFGHIVEICGLALIVNFMDLKILTWNVRGLENRDKKSGGL